MTGGFTEARANRAFGTRLANCQSQRPADAAVLADAPEVDRDQQRHGKRNGDAMQHVKAQERRFADEAAAQQQEARIAARVDELHAADRQNLAPGPSYPMNGVARAMLLPTVMAQIAS